MQFEKGDRDMDQIHPSSGFRLAFLLLSPWMRRTKATSTKWMYVNLDVSDLGYFVYVNAMHKDEDAD